METVICIHPHAQERMSERGVTESEIKEAILHGERFLAKFERSGFRRNFPGNYEWRGHRYGTKQVEVYACKNDNGWLVITVLVKYF